MDKIKLQRKISKLYSDGELTNQEMLNLKRLDTWSETDKELRKVMAAKKKRRKTSKKKKAHHGGKIPLPILKRRLVRLEKIVKARS